jgi:sulfatase maturation enzyme AslB (radical SAM superfamily)
MIWQCNFIEHGISIFPDGRIRPCCQVSADYSKPISEISNPNRFNDLKTSSRPDACKICWNNEDRGLHSYRTYANKVTLKPSTGIKYLDFRHSNQCNLKCRYCSPHFSNQWAKELNNLLTLKKTSVNLDSLITEDLEDVYWCGGEPLMMKDHYDFLNKVIELNFSSNITLRYNTNLTILDYKNVDIVKLWKKFKSVNIAISIDAIGTPLEYIRSGCKWSVIEYNIKRLIQICQTNPGININFAPTVSMLNLWFLPELIEYAEKNKIKTNLNVLTGPDYLSLWAIPVQLQHQAREKIIQIQNQISKEQFDQLMQMLSRDDNEYLFLHAVRHILLLDKIRNENLFDLLPFKDLTIDLTIKNYEYE